MIKLRPLAAQERVLGRFRELGQQALRWIYVEDEPDEEPQEALSRQACQRPFLVALHHQGEADHVSGKDRGEAAGGHSGTPAFFIRQ